jgi:hypothetical protein
MPAMPAEQYDACGQPLLAADVPLTRERGLRYPCLPQTLRPVTPALDATGA